MAIGTIGYDPAQDDTDSDNDILTLAVERFRKALESDDEERTLANDDKRFAINHEGCQWDEGTRAAREGASPSRPCLTVNKIPEKLDVAEGEFLQLQTSVKVHPVDSNGDPVVADIIGGLLRHIDQISSAETAYHTAYSDLLYCGRGAWRVNVQDTEKDPFLKEIRVGRIPNILSIVFDPNATEIDRSDMKYCFVTDWLSENEFKALYPDVSMDSWSGGEEYIWSGWRDETGVRIAEYWWKEFYDRVWCRVNRQIGPEFMQMTVPFDELADEEKESIPPENKKTVKDYKVMWCKMTASQIIEGPHEWPGRYIPIIVVTGKSVNIDGKTKSRGMVRFAKTPQRMYNYMSSSMVEQVALAPKAPYLIADDQLGPYQEIWDQAHLQNYVYLPFKISAQNPNFIPKREMPPQLSSAYAFELQQRNHEIMSAMGRYSPSLGGLDKERSGLAIQSLQRQGNIGSLPFVKRMNYALKHSARLIVDLIPHIYDSERVLRIVGDEGEELQVPVNVNEIGNPLLQQASPQVQESLVSKGISQYFNDLTTGKYDVVFSIGPSYATIREEIVAQLVELTKVAPQLAGITMEMIVENLDVPKAYKLLEKMKQSMQPQPDPKIQLEQEKLKLDLHEQLRKDFEARIRAVESLARAEAMERGQQMQKYIADVDQVMKMMQMEASAQKD